MNRSIKLLEVNVCHLTQFAFFWSFVAKHGLVLFDKNHSSKYCIDYVKFDEFSKTYLVNLSNQRRRHQLAAFHRVRVS